MEIIHPEMQRNYESFRYRVRSMIVYEIVGPACCRSYLSTAPNGVHYPLVGATRQRHFAGTHFKPRKVLENAHAKRTTPHLHLRQVQVCPGVC